MVMMTALEDAIPPLLKKPRIKKQSRKQEGGVSTCGDEIQNKIKDIHELLTNLDNALLKQAQALVGGNADAEAEAQADQILLLYDVYNFIMIFLFTKGSGSITTSKPAKDMGMCKNELKEAVAYFNDPSITPSSPFVNNFKIKLEIIGYKKMSNNKIEYKTSSFSKFLDEYINALKAVNGKQSSYKTTSPNKEVTQTPNMSINFNRLRYRFEKDAPVSSVINNFSF